MAGSRGAVYMEEKAQDGMVAARGILEADSCRFFAISFLPAPPHQDKRLHGASGSFLNRSFLSLCSDFLFLLQFSEAHHL